MESMSERSGGFSFDNVERNHVLEDKGMKMPKAAKTGTTIVGVVYKDGVVLGADTRATSDTTVFEKYCEKIHYIAPNIYCCGAGTAADTEHTTAMIASKLELHRLDTGRQSRVTTCLTMLKRHLFQYQGYVSAALVLGGVDLNGPHLYTVYPHGSTDSLPFVTMGSGSLAAMAVFESKYKDDMTLEEGKQIVYEAISAGIFNDMGSGGNVNLCVITKDKTEMLEGYAKENMRPWRKSTPYAFPKTEVLTSKIDKPRTDISVVVESEKMEVSAS
uniref:Proteasome subunit beta n=1 Tax=Rhodosorus marinus TaxID=101924 RepID=A0A7S3ED16_9RHOD|mmetsp:Transcript_26467/g.103099  ORF Transcript_26467/g.103099 Transcript_26467/m.103099 type:complete len:273 (+) Transcript_26467:194-1012(+)|eukprot:CAMPEP_0113965658 /NCGR_PEP_ID=MMETSP0011_2-20120614/7871_1 /TAXON_ID=101924 /ORGANISM="Rhodosorus marinus" /LENGTH=272 /DNA_ID=CAMNT_0000978203 /DNA_START=162 /DNA_END=977 /DNA_ORIENTATION=+ /assembly_acc=CAM_ASM_000156